MRIRRGNETDYPAFARLFPELGLDQGVPEEARFRVDMLPGMLIAERDGETLGYCVVDTRDGGAYLSQLSVAPDARRHGVGSALMAAAAMRARALGAEQWTLHLDPRQPGLTRFYESRGFARDSVCSSIRLSSDALDALAREPTPELVTRAFEPSDAERVERALGFDDASVERELSKLGRFGILAEDSTGIVAGAVLAPALRSAYPFRVRSGFAAPFLAALRAHTVPSEDLFVAVQGDEETVRELVALGGVVRLETVMYRAALG